MSERLTDDALLYLFDLFLSDKCVLRNKNENLAQKSHLSCISGKKYVLQHPYWQVIQSQNLLTKY